MVKVIVMQKSLSKIKSLWICCALKEYSSFIIVSIAITFLTVLEKNALPKPLNKGKVGSGLQYEGV